MSTTSADAPALEAGSHQRIVDGLRRSLGDGLLESVLDRGDLWVRVDRAVWHKALETCKRKLGLTFFSFLSGIDWAPAPGLSGENTFKGEEAGEGDEPVEVDEVVAEIRTGLAGGDTRFQVFARLHDVRRHVGVTLKADLDDHDPRVATVTDLFRGADWHEREAWEMFGFSFDGHPGLRHLYLPGEFEGHPLRKDFPLLSREVKPWPGLVNVEQIPFHLDPKNQPAPEPAAPPAEPEPAAAADPTAPAEPTAEAEADAPPAETPSAPAAETPAAPPAEPPPAPAEGGAAG
ncbi:MAG TPA: NADH-quinone oxidoreductase subunit C [Acidimicrobiales bacterium]|nr:NADH-quinone oxidoreductase subunit C [Acidimicrobiales bacterium]